jgi:hypothetical protein
MFAPVGSAIDLCRGLVNGLRLHWAVRLAGNAESRVVIVQSSDRDYRTLLSVTGRVNAHYARRHAYGYCRFVGNLSATPSTANFNRYYIIRYLVDLQKFGWALWLDADAMIVDHTRRLEDVVELSPRQLLIACAGQNHGHYDINSGVFFVNLGHPRVLRMTQSVIDECERLGPNHSARTSDQHHLQQWLRRHAGPEGIIPFLRRFCGPDASAFNYRGDFIRHELREYGTPEQRLEVLKQLAARFDLDGGAESSA